MNTSVSNINRIVIRVIGSPVEMLETTGKDVITILSRIKFPKGLLCKENMESVVKYNVKGCTIQLFSEERTICTFELMGTTILISSHVPNLTKILNRISSFYIYTRPI